MKGRWLWLVICANLAVLVALAFVYPHLMVAPGALEKGHAELSSDCFACHTPLHGATADRCLSCHKLPDIGLRTTTGAALAQGQPVKLAFHQELADSNCMACHSDHAGPKLTHKTRHPFSHAMLREATRDRCESCHQAPKDALHRTMSGNCAQCHRPPAWKPASFDHDKLFPLDGDHQAACVTCHVGNDFKRYTCYGCHEHTTANILAEHRKEGVSENLADCVRCHRSGSAEGEGRREQGRRERD